MEQKLVRVPFDVEMAKKITNGDVDGKIVTRDGRSARIICWDKKGGIYPVFALIDNGDEEIYKSYTNEGVWNTDKICTLTKYNLMLEIPEYMTFKDGDIIACGNENCSWISIIKSLKSCADGIVTAFYVTLVIKGCDERDGLLSFEMFTNTGKWARLATEAERQTMINALNEFKEPIAKEYLKRFFGIETKPEYNFKPFDKVLVRDDDNQKWRIDLFSHQRDNGLYVGFEYSWKYCIPYNEETKHLHNTTEKWEE